MAGEEGATVPAGSNSASKQKNTPQRSRRDSSSRDSGKSRRSSNRPRSTEKPKQRRSDTPRAHSGDDERNGTLAESESQRKLKHGQKLTVKENGTAAASSNAKVDVAKEHSLEQKTSSSDDNSSAAVEKDSVVPSQQKVVKPPLRVINLSDSEITSHSETSSVSAEVVADFGDENAAWTTTPPITKAQTVRTPTRSALKSLETNKPLSGAMSVRFADGVDPESIQFAGNAPMRKGILQTNVRSRKLVHTGVLFLRELRRDYRKLVRPLAKFVESEDSSESSVSTHGEAPLTLVGPWRRRTCRLFAAWTGDFAGDGTMELSIECGPLTPADSTEVFETYALATAADEGGSAHLETNGARLPPCFKPHVFGAFRCWTEGKNFGEDKLEDFVDVLLCSADDATARLTWAKHVSQLLAGTHELLQDTAELDKRVQERELDSPEYWEGFTPVVMFHDMAKIPYYSEDQSESWEMYTAKVSVAEEMVKALCLQQQKNPSSYALFDVSKDGARIRLADQQVILQVLDTWPVSSKSCRGNRRFALCRRAEWFDEDEASDGDAADALVARAAANDTLALAPGEHITYTIKATRHDSQGQHNQPGSIVLSSMRLVFIAFKQQRVTASVPLMLIEKVFKAPSLGASIQVLCKNSRRLYFSLPEHAKHARKNMLSEIVRNLPNAQTSTYAFELPYTLPKESGSFNNTTSPRRPFNGWKLYSPQREYKRMLGYSLTSQKDSDDVDDEAPGWRITKMNKGYEICESYPQVLVVPAVISDTLLVRNAEYRSRQRIPVLAWRHPNTGAALCRSAQPLSGLRGISNAQDEALLDAIRVAHLRRSEDSFQKRLAIIDCRPKRNAQFQAVTSGGGYEHVGSGHYKHCDLEFYNIGNIHVMRKSLHAVYKYCYGVVVNSDLAIEETRSGKVATPPEQEAGVKGWLKHIKRLLECAIHTANLLEAGTPVLNHCSDGWDRTSQIVALVQLVLDPYYRTIEGFAVLIEKDWVSFGHKFARRHGHDDSDAKSHMWDAEDKQRAPIFLQFLDSVFQLFHLFPTAFEFNPNLLLLLAEHSFSCCFGTFLFNNPRQKLENKVVTRTRSVWDLVEANAEALSNDSYDAAVAVAIPDLEQVELKLWREYFFRWHVTEHIGAEFLPSHGALELDLPDAPTLAYTPSILEFSEDHNLDDDDFERRPREESTRTRAKGLFEFNSDGSVREAVALKDFSNASDPDRYLSADAGDIIRLVSTDDEVWWEGIRVKDKKQGIFRAADVVPRSGDRILLAKSESVARIKRAAEAEDAIPDLKKASRQTRTLSMQPRSASNSPMPNSRPIGGLHAVALANHALSESAVASSLANNPKSDRALVHSPSWRA